MEDIHIINLFLERSEDAIRQVEVKYEKFCFKIAWNILYNTEDSEECVNDTWLITWNKIPPKTPIKLPAFLGKITRNLALDNFRKKNASKYNKVLSGRGYKEKGNFEYFRKIFK